MCRSVTSAASRRPLGAGPTGVLSAYDAGLNTPTTITAPDPAAAPVEENTILSTPTTTPAPATAVSAVVGYST